MVTAVDSSVLFDVFGANQQFGRVSANALRTCLKQGRVIASEVVWAEMGAAFPSVHAFENWMDQFAVFFSPVTQEAAGRAAREWRRHRARGGHRERIIGDFLVGAHAVVCADRLLTRDHGFYRQYFSGLKVLDPSV